MKLLIQKLLTPKQARYLHFREGEVLEVDHILAISLGGKDEYRNLQLLHGHCHDEKTALDMEQLRIRQSITPPKGYCDHS